VCVQILGHWHSGLPAGLASRPCCHSREGGNPESFECFLDPCLRRGDKVGLVHRNSRPPGYFHRHQGKGRGVFGPAGLDLSQVGGNLEPEGSRLQRRWSRTEQIGPPEKGSIGILARKGGAHFNIRPVLCDKPGVRGRPWERSKDRGGTQFHDSVAIAIPLQGSACMEPARAFRTVVLLLC